VEEKMSTTHVSSSVEFQEADDVLDNFAYLSSGEQMEHLEPED
jgi:hypothetical protein